MLTKNEVAALNLSPTKKDFVQIWNELLEIAGKLSERWDPTSTNESDPGIVILKALTGIADKLNYNIDKNTLEAFMPTAAQEDSMRKLCDMLGYNMKYYRSAETSVTIKYYNPDASDDEKTAMEAPGLLIPKFTVLTNGDQDVNYFTINQQPLYISSLSSRTDSIPCMEGQIVKCESTSDNNVITISQISENNRFYLPEYQIAENGIFIYNVDNTMGDGDQWEKVDNLNIQSRGSRVFKFGYDSYEGRPYVEFPDDYSELVNDGLYIYYARTSGADGNISAKTLTQLELPSGDGWDKVSAESFSVENAFSATTGANIETIGQAYNNFKKTIGTFETLVTCRDYMNKIYSMTDDLSGKPLVSNILATDIRSDLNRAVTICSCDDAGIFYKDTSLTQTTVKTLKLKNSSSIVEVEDEEPLINHFDLVLYPFKSYNQIRNNVKDIQAVYDSSFNYTEQNFETITSKLEESRLKTIAHNIIPPREHDIVSINNYLRLNAIIGTNSKMSAEEGELLKDSVKIALANAFNMHELDFGEEIPFDSIVDVIENADPRIKVVSLAEPALYTTFTVLDEYTSYDETGKPTGNPVLKEYAVASDWLSEAQADSTGRFEYSELGDGTFDSVTAKEIYNKLAVRNVLAGRVPLFKYNTTFSSSFSEGAYQTTSIVSQPTCLNEPTAVEPFVIAVENGVTYTGQWIALSEKPEDFDNAPDNIKYTSQQNNETGEVEYAKIIYTKTETPDPYVDNFITKADDKNNITEITTSCIILPDADGATITNVALAEGELIKFRAPNFTTVKTYPAYVNYHLELNKALEADAAFAKAYTLYELLNTKLSDMGEVADTRRQAILDYFEDRGHKKTFELTQKIYKKVDPNAEPSTSSPSVNIDNSASLDTENTLNKVFAKSGFIKLVSSTATVRWVSDPNSGPNIVIPEFNLTNGSNSFITNANVVEKIKEHVDNTVKTLNNENSQALPTTDDWTVSYTFEYVPFEVSTLPTWKEFIKENGAGLFGFTPVVEAKNVFWHVSSAGYSKGKYVLDTYQKLLNFTSGDFGYLESSASALMGVYVAESLGADEKPDFINNDEEYMLRSGEYLYIEYTPSTTAEDGTTQSQEPVTEVLGPGTIIKPNGFETGLVDYDAASGKTAHKTVTFNINGGASKSVPLLSLGASEQIEVRDFAQVVLNRQTLPGASGIYVYKNFNNCPELETIPSDTTGYDENKNRINNVYTLKDGEYIFYTDQDKSEFAYFTTGTQVTLTGATYLNKFDIIDLATIFDSGIQEIPWQKLDLSRDNGIVFQEFQYVTLGAGDKLNNLTLDSDRPADKKYLDSTWQKCNDVSYTPVGSSDSVNLPSINVSDSFNNGNGWEVISTLDLSVSPDTAQTLRNTDKVRTSVTLHKEKDETADKGIVLSASDKDHPLAFKTNLNCQATSDSLKLTDLYSNPNKAKSFEVKVFSETTPVVIKTLPGKLAPYRDALTTTEETLNVWSEGESLSIDELSTVWKPIALTSIAPEEAYDNALKLSTVILPNTYGIFSIYIDYRDSYRSGAQISQETWLEVLPGVDIQSISLLNVPKSTWTGNKLYLNPGINCIRVDKTTDIFIKARAEYVDTKAETWPDGALYFDNIRLVDCSPIEYVNGTKKTTQGLNLEQLGYLYISDNNDFSIIGERTRKKLREEITAEALTDLETLNQSESKKKATALAEVKKSESKLKVLTDFVTDAHDEASATLDNYKDNNNDLDGLFTNYKELAADLEQERHLKEELEKNSNIHELESQLVGLLESFDDMESSKQTLLNELDSLEQTTSANANSLTKDTLSKSDIFDDFEAVADINTHKNLINDLKLASISEINARYAADLEVIEAAVRTSVSAEAVPNLLAILTDFSVGTHASLITQIQTLVESNKTEITNLLSSAISSFTTDTATERYSNLSANLKAVREALSSVDVSSLVSKIKITAEAELPNSNKYELLNNYIKQLREKLIGDTPIAGSYASLVKDVNEILVNAQVVTPDDAAITAALEALSTKVTGQYYADITMILDSIETTLEEIHANYESYLATLADSDNTAVKAIGTSLSACIESRGVELAAVEAFSITLGASIQSTYTSLPYGASAVLSVWPNYMKRSFIAGVDKLYKDVRLLINNPSTEVTFSLDDGFYSNVTTETQRRALIRSANIDAFESLFERAKDLVNENTQSDNRKTLINTLATQVSTSSTLSSALETIKNDSGTYANRHTVLKQLITELLTDTITITEKQEILAKLKTELDAVINLDTQLEEITAKLLCPSILLYGRYGEHAQELETDDFYARFRDFITYKHSDATDPKAEGIRTELLELEADFASKLATIQETLSTIKTILSLLVEATDKDDFTNIDSYWTNDALNPVSSTLLTSDYLIELSKVKDAIDVQNQISRIKSSKLLNILQDDDLVVAWQDSDGNWIDTAGNASTLTGVDLKCVYIKGDGSTEGSWEWQDAVGNAVVVKNTDGTWVIEDEEDDPSITDTALSSVVTTLYNNAVDLGQFTGVSSAFKDAYDILLLEDQLLTEIREIDKNRDFYYNVPVESGFAIDFNEGDATLNTLMNPALNYDINNVNNNFVISKIDINYLDKGLQIARSSRLN